jgi:tRNA pseudouridine55 synthase
VLVVDKSRGPTSHDIVGRVRRAFDTGAVGHAGTLDPMATGVLVVAVGEATKLVAHLTAADKEYEATLSLGTETDSDDADGCAVRRAEVPWLTREIIETAAGRFIGPGRQRPPVVSAIKVDGKALHARVRRGEIVEAPERDVLVHSLTIIDFDETEIRFAVRAAKGFYVRALGRDLAVAVGTVGHLSALRRTKSGDFGLERAVPADTVFRAANGDDDAKRSLEDALVPLEEAWSGFRTTLTPDGVIDSRHGRAIVPDRRGPIEAARETADEPGGAASAVAGDVVALFDGSGRLVALARLEASETLKVARGFASTGGESDAT